MIRSSVALKLLFEQGRTVARLCELTGGTHFRWVTADTNEPVHSQAIKTLEKKGLVRVIVSDLCGEPMQLGAA